MFLKKSGLTIVVSLVLMTSGTLVTQSTFADLSCNSRCKDGLGECLLIPWRGGDRDDEAKALRDAFVQAQFPSELTNHEIALIFEMTHWEEMYTRGSVIFDSDGNFSNSGEARNIVIRSDAANVDILGIYSPPVFAGRLWKTGRGENTALRIDFDDPEKAFILNMMTSEVLEGRFGGAIQRIDIDADRVVATVAKGCLEIALHPLPMSELVARQGRTIAVLGSDLLDSAMDGFTRDDIDDEQEIFP